MVNKPLFFKLMRDLWQRRIMLFALILILTVGVCCYVGMAGVYRDLDGARANYYHKYNLANFTLDLKRAPEAAVHQLINIPNVLRLRRRIKINAMVELPAKSYKQFIRLIPGDVISLPVPKRDMINDIRMVTGTWFSDPYAHEAIVDQQFAAARHLHIGDRIKVRLPDQEHELLIVGTVTSPEYTSVLSPGNLAPNPGGFAILYMPFRYLQQCADLNGSFNQLLGMTRETNTVAIKNTMDLLARKLDHYGVLLETAQQDQVSVKIIHDELVNVEKTTAILPTMFFLVVILVLNVMMTRMIAQQRNTIGTLKALGYSNFAILRHYISFGLIVGLIGGLVGFGFGYLLQYGLLELYKTYFAIPNMVTHFYISVFGMGMLLSLGSALLGALVGTKKAINFTPAVAMRPPAPEKGAHILLEKIKFFWKAISFRRKMVMRAIFRSRIRSAVTVSACILATALVLTALGFVDAMYEMLNFSFDTIQHQDYTVTLRDPLGIDIMRTVATLPGVKQVEGQLGIATKIQSGPYIKTMEITGIPADNKLFTPVDKEGRQIKISGTGLVLNETLAHILHVKTGDIVKIRPLIGERKTTTVKVAKIIKTYLGLAIYADQSWLSRLVGDSYLTNRILFTLKRNANKRTFLQATRKFAPVVDITSHAEDKKLVIDTFNRFMIFTAMIIIAFAGVIAMGSILNTAIISLSERERDVAGLRLLGFSKIKTASIFFEESLILNAIGIVLGFFLGVYFLYYTSTEFSTELFRMPMVVKPIRLLETGLIMLSFVLVSQAIVFRIIMKLNWFSVLNTNE